MNHEAVIELKWAKPDDEPDIRALVESVPMPGAVAVRFARQPDYFLGATIMGDTCDVLIARQRPGGELAGVACRAERRAFLNGRESALGYVGQIRIQPAFRGRWLVQHGAKWFREASPPGLLYMGVIASENPRARGVLAGPRLLQDVHVRRLCGLTTCAILLRPPHEFRVSGIDVRQGSPEVLEEIVEFLRRHGPRRQFFPAYTLDDFTGGAALRGLKLQDVMVARRGGSVTGVMAVWDQSTYKQDIVDSYGPGLRRLRPVYNMAARLLGAQPLTPPGQAIPLAFASCMCVADDDLAVMRALLFACMRSAYERGKAFLMIGLADDDPLLPIARRTLHITYRSDLFAASWSEEPLRLLDERIPYIEIATL